MNWPLEAIKGDPVLTTHFMAQVSARGANEGGIRLALILCASAPCEACGFVKKHCRCPMPREFDS